jgi:hypothetical protein
VPHPSCGKKETERRTKHNHENKIKREEEDMRFIFKKKD